MIVFLDFEASSLHRDGYPIEVGWVMETGIGESHIIRPQADWVDWSSDAQSTHGLTQVHLAANGEPAPDVARLVHQVLTGHQIYSDAPAADAKWLARLLATAGLPPLPVDHVFDAYRIAMRPLVARLHHSLAASIARSVHANAERAAAAGTRHRAEPDARRLYATWINIGAQVADICK